VTEIDTCVAEKREGLTPLDRDRTATVYAAVSPWLRRRKWWKPAEWNRELVSRVIVQVNAEPQKHRQAVWVTLDTHTLRMTQQRSDLCGTAACLGGWTAILAREGSLTTVVSDLLGSEILTDDTYTLSQVVDLTFDAVVLTAFETLFPTTPAPPRYLIHDRNHQPHTWLYDYVFLQDDPRVAVAKFAALFAVDPFTGELLTLP
jgi:hypothetical protein